VNDPATRQLNRYINVSVEWKAKSGSGFDTFPVEGFQFAGIDRNLDRSAGWPATTSRSYTGPAPTAATSRALFNAGWPWEGDYLLGRLSRTPVIKTWA